VLLRDFPDWAGEEPELVARHFSLGLKPDRAIEFWQAAGRRAGQRSAHFEAIANLEMGLEDLAKIAASSNANSNATETEIEKGKATETELDLRIALGASLLAVEGWSATVVRDNYARAQALCRDVDDSSRIINVLWGLGNVFLLKGEITSSRELAERQLSIAQAEGDDSLLMSAYRAMGMCAFFVGDFAVAQTELQRANALYNPEVHGSHRFSEGTDPAVISLSLSAWARWFLGDAAAARREAELSVAHAAALQHPFSQAYAHSLAASVHQCCHQPDEALENAKAAIVLAEENDYPIWLGWATALQGWAVSALGDPQAGVKLLLRGAEIYRSTGALQIKSYIQTLLAEAHALAGDAEAGLAALAGAHGGGNPTDVTFYQAEALRLEGELRLRSRSGQGVDDLGVDDLGLEHLQNALAFATRQNAPALQLRAATSLYDAVPDGAHGPAARAQITEIIGLLERDPADLDRAKADDILGKSR
jgi:predicted ATPase